MSPLVGLGCGGVALGRAVGGVAASGSPGSKFSVMASSSPCSVLPGLLRWCCSVPVDRVRIAARVEISTLSLSEPLCGACVVMVGGAVVLLVVRALSRSPLFPLLPVLVRPVVRVGPLDGVLGLWRGRRHGRGGRGDCVVVGAAASWPWCIPEVPCGPSVALPGRAQKGAADELDAAFSASPVCVTSVARDAEEEKITTMSFLGYLIQAEPPLKAFC